MAIEWRKSSPENKSRREAREAFDAAEKSLNLKDTKPSAPTDIDQEIVRVKAEAARRREAINSGHNAQMAEFDRVSQAAAASTMARLTKDGDLRAAESQARVDAANDTLAKSVEELKKKFPNL